MVDGSQPRSLSKEKKIIIKIYLLAVFGKFRLFSGNFVDFIIDKLCKKNQPKFWNVGGKNKKSPSVYLSCWEQFQLIVKKISQNFRMLEEKIRKA